MALPLFIATENNEFTNRIRKIIEAAQFSAQITHINTLDEVATTADSVDSGVILTDVIWNQANISDYIYGLMISHPNLGWGIVTQYDPSQIIIPFFPAPVYKDGTDQALLIEMVSSLAEDLRGSNFGVFQLKDFATQHHLGRTFKAFQPGINRNVWLTISPQTASDNDREVFRATSTAMAQNIHPAVYTVYESGDVVGRPFLAAEPVNDPTLAALTAKGVHLDDRYIARIIKVITQVLLHFETNNIGSQLFNTNLITMSQQGVIKICNTAVAQKTGSAADSYQQLQQIAQIIYPLFKDNIQHHPGILDIYNKLQSENYTVARATQDAQELDVALAPVKEMPKRKEKQVAEVAVQKARKKSLIIFGASALAATIFGFIFIIYLINSSVSLPGTITEKNMELIFIPAGKVQIDGTNKSINVNSFTIYQYEVTIGMYEKFLNDEKIKNTSPTAYFRKNFKNQALAPQVSTKFNFFPKDWKDIMKSIKNPKLPFRGQTINRDTPIFNVDYFDALAYSHWAGRRLPTESQWQLAASGSEERKLPWGNPEKGDKTIIEKANTGFDMNPIPGKVEAGEKDGYRGPGPVNAFPEDKTPEGVLCMGGNVSEWCTVYKRYTIKEYDGEQIYKGSHFEYPRLIPMASRKAISPYTREPWLGFRCIDVEE
ncbi:MAG: SUMF1/EgtB/PvdO family nonheme iron enzyme [Verrucomicrobiota bacterium]